MVLSADDDTFEPSNLRLEHDRDGNKDNCVRGFRHNRPRALTANMITARGRGLQLESACLGACLLALVGISCSATCGVKVVGDRALPCLSVFADESVVKGTGADNLCTLLLASSCYSPVCAYGNTGRVKAPPDFGSCVSEDTKSVRESGNTLTLESCLNFGVADKRGQAWRPDKGTFMYAQACAKVLGFFGGLSCRHIVNVDASLDTYVSNSQKKCLSSIKYPATASASKPSCWNLDNDGVEFHKGGRTTGFTEWLCPDSRPFLSKVDGTCHKCTSPTLCAPGHELNLAAVGGCGAPKLLARSACSPTHGGADYSLEGWRKAVVDGHADLGGTLLCVVKMTSTLTTHTTATRSTTPPHQCNGNPDPSWCSTSRQYCDIEAYAYVKSKCPGTCNTCPPAMSTPISNTSAAATTRTVLPSAGTWSSTASAPLDRTASAYSTTAEQPPAATLSPAFPATGTAPWTSPAPSAAPVVPERTTQRATAPSTARTTNRVPSTAPITGRTITRAPTALPQAQTEADPTTAADTSATRDARPEETARAPFPSTMSWANVTAWSVLTQAASASGTRETDTAVPRTGQQWIAEGRGNHTNADSTPSSTQGNEPSVTATIVALAGTVLVVFMAGIAAVMCKARRARRAANTPPSPAQRQPTMPPLRVGLDLGHTVSNPAYVHPGEDPAPRAKSDSPAPTCQATEKGASAGPVYAEGGLRSQAKPTAEYLEPVPVATHQAVEGGASAGPVYAEGRLITAGMQRPLPTADYVDEQHAGNAGNADNAPLENSGQAAGHTMAPVYAEIPCSADGAHSTPSLYDTMSAAVPAVAEPGSSKGSTHARGHEGGDAQPQPQPSTLRRKGSLLGFGSLSHSADGTNV